MKMDLQQFHKSVDRIQGDSKLDLQGATASSTLSERTRGKEYVDCFLQAFHLPREADILDFVRTNRHEYEARDLVSLVLGGFGAKAKKKKQKELQELVESICAGA